MQRLGKPWNRRPATKVFLDKSGLAASGRLWPSIHAALDASQWLVVLASPEAARSDGVYKEITYWVSSKDPDHLLVVHTGGSFAWDKAKDKISRESTAWNPKLRRVFRTEPLPVDLTWARDSKSLTLRNARFRLEVVRLIATIRGVPWRKSKARISVSNSGSARLSGE